MYNKQCMAIVGLQWGDEGKAKLVDYFAKDYDVVVRWNGGPNAGHTVYNRAGDRFGLHQVPCGVFREKALIIGPECYVDIDKLIAEVRMLEMAGYLPNIFVDSKATVISDCSIVSDKEDSEDGIKTTGCGVGPSAACRSYRTAWMVGRERGKLLGSHIHVVDTVDMVYNMIRSGMRILFEGAQSIDLDNVHGQYPYVSQRCMTGNILTSFGMLPALRKMDVLGVAKAYVTRSGNGPMVTEMSTSEEAVLRLIVDETGVTTGRRRRVGWLDIPQLVKTSRLAGCNSIAITKIDILAKLVSSRMCTHYRRNNVTYSRAVNDFEGIEPVYDTYRGIAHEINGDFCVIRKGECGVWINSIERSLGLGVSIVSFGPMRNELIFL